jgi:hypothetical protein
MKKIFAVVVLCLMASMAWGADSDGTKQVDVVSDPNSNIKRIDVAWTASAIAEKVDVVIKGVAGMVIKFVTNPGSPAPADNYDITVLDSHGIDIAGATLANRDTSTTEMVWATTDDGTTDAQYGVPVVGDLTATFTGLATGDCEGVLSIYVEIKK